MVVPRLSKLVCMRWHACVELYSSQSCNFLSLSYGSFYNYRLTLIPVYISNYTQCVGWKDLYIHKMSTCSRWNLGIDKLLHSILYWPHDYSPTLGLNLNHFSKGTIVVCQPPWKPAIPRSAMLFAVWVCLDITRRTFSRVGIESSQYSKYINLILFILQMLTLILLIL